MNQPTTAMCEQVISDRERSIPLRCYRFASVKESVLVFADVLRQTVREESTCLVDMVKELLLSNPVNRPVLGRFANLAQLFASVRLTMPLK